ncbi:MAG: hypothetical protein ABI051_05245 [Vicinamibacterales bacterium]
MWHWLRKAPPPYEAALAMIGVKAGQRVLVLDAGYPRLAGELARVTGLNGLTQVWAREQDRAATDAAAAEAGALIDFVVRDAVPTPQPGTFDLAIWVAPLAAVEADRRLTRTHDALHMLRPGGRIIVIDDTRPTGGFSRSRPSAVGSEQVVALMAAAGALASRALGAIDGLTYYEGQQNRQAADSG